jgi:hypothetical protein
VEQEAFLELKKCLSSDEVLVHFDPSLPLVIACNASIVGIGAVLFHHYTNGEERPIANTLKNLNTAQHN